MLVVAVGVGAPVYLGFADPAVPRAWWLLVFVGTLALLLAAAWDDSHLSPGRPSPRSVAGLVGAAVGSWVLLLTSPGMEMIAILLVLVAALAVYIVQFRWVLALIAANSLVLTGYGALNLDATNTVVVVALYVMIQLASALSCAAILREQRLRRDLVAANVELRAANALLAESARTAERLRISRDLHDTIGHHLTVLALELEAAKHRSDDPAREHIDRAGSLARELLGQVRATVHEMRSESGDLTAILQQIGQDIPGLDVRVNVDPQVLVGETEQVALVRAAQEIVSNTLRHAGGKCLTIGVRRDDRGGTVLTAVDDGRGHRTAADCVSAGNGLRGMVERFEALGGNVILDGSDGFRVTAQVPAR